MCQTSSVKSFLLSQGFLMEDKLQKLLAPLEKEEQVVVKLGSLISVSSHPVVSPLKKQHS